MRCEEAVALLGAYCDGELDGPRSAAVAGHVAGCAACASAAAYVRRLGPVLREATYEKAPPDLAARIGGMLAAEAARTVPVTDAAVVASPRPKRAGWGVWVQRAAALLVACGLSAVAASYLTRSSLERSLLSRDLVTAHVRSLLQDTTVQVVSSDRHTVKPWFTGKTEFSPTVKDLSAEGFALVGGRLDYVGERRVAVVVYKRRQHVVNVFCWPSSAPAAAGLADKLADDAASLAINGYNGVQWYAGGMRYWAVSDLNPAELTQLQAFLSS